MCGVFAAIAPKGSPPCRFAPHATRLLTHRGPDASGTQHVALSWASITLGMTRLKIVDQTDLIVPYDFREGRGVVLVYNGELYNWRELRAGLSGPWETECDAEVVAALWREHGPACLDRMNGMWAFVLVDTWTDSVFVARDRAGEKPLYWAQREGAVYLASEAKALPVDLNVVSCSDVRTLEFDCGAETPIGGVFSLPPASCALLAHPGPVDGDFAAEIGTWWRLPETEGQESFPLDELEALVVDAIRIRYVSERPVAVQLSGGLDSAIIQAVVNADRLYCVTFPDLDNLDAARKAARGKEVTPVSFSLEELFDVLPTVAYHLDTPGTWSAVCQWFMNRRIAQDGGVVVLSGEGADELWAGYARYRVLYWLDRMLEDGHLETYGPLIRRMFAGDMTGVLARTLNRGSEDALFHAAQLIEEHGGEGSLVARMARTDYYTTMQVLLRMADRTTAAFGLEGRAPFLDYRLMELAARIPTRAKVDGTTSKVPLRMVARRLGVPDSIVDERVKRGLTIPAAWGQRLAQSQEWDRRWFAARMSRTWMAACLHPAFCTSCCETR